MSTELELAKKILTKGRELNDIDLITMGVEMLERAAVQTNTVGWSVDELEDVVIPKKRGRPKKAASVPAPKWVNTASQEDLDELADSFDRSMAGDAPTNNIVNSIQRRQPVSGIGKKNLWHDDRTEELGDIGKTPLRIVKKRPPVKLATFVCGTCGKKEKKRADLIMTEKYRCDNCILGGGRIRDEE